jgi:hypothetical protein
VSKPGLAAIADHLYALHDLEDETNVPNVLVPIDHILQHVVHYTDLYHKQAHYG